MQHDPRAYLWDVQEAIVAIYAFAEGLDAQAYVMAPMVHAAVERKFEIIGEAINQLGKLGEALAARIPHRRQIVAFRNLLIHGYAAVNQHTVWDTVQVSLPPLLASVQALLQELSEA